LGVSVEKKFIAALLLGTITLIVVLLAWSLIFYPATRDYLNFTNASIDISYSNDFGQGSSGNEYYPFDVFSSDIEKCISFKDSDCYCSLKSSFIQKPFAVIIINNGDKGSLSLIKNAKISSCYIEGDYDKLKQKNFNVNFYIENILTSPDLVSKDNNLKGFKKDDFTAVTELLFSENKLCSQKDIKGRNEITFSNGILYKFDSSSIALVNIKEGLNKKCKIE